MKARPRFWISGLVAVSCVAWAHDIPNDVTVQMFLKPEGQRALLLVRVPMKAMRDVEFPQWGPGYLDFDKADPFLHDAATLWISDALQFYEDNSLLPKPRVADVRASLESDRSFASFDQALAHVAGPKLTNQTKVVWNQTYLDVLFEYPIRSERSNFAIHPALDRLGVRVVTVLRFLPPSSGPSSENVRPVRAFEFTG